MFDLWTMFGVAAGAPGPTPELRIMDYGRANPGVAEAPLAPGAGSPGYCVRELRTNGKVVAMASDGAHDASALAEADMGIVMGTGMDVAVESAGVTLVKGELAGIAWERALSRAVMRNIRQNLFFAFVYNVAGVPIAAGLGGSVRWPEEGEAEGQEGLTLEVRPTTGVPDQMIRGRQAARFHLVGVWQLGRPPPARRPVLACRGHRLLLAPRPGSCPGRRDRDPPPSQSSALRSRGSRPGRRCRAAGSGLRRRWSWGLKRLPLAILRPLNSRP
jgi:hypothetical protein